MVTTEADDELLNFCNNPPQGWNITYLETAESTNTLGMELGRKGALAGAIVIADMQSAGRGRLGKTWHSYAGCGLYISMVLRPRLPLEQLSRITLAAGVALAQTTALFIKEKPMLKWPNDLYLQGRKCGGILAESDVRQGKSPLVILGMGVNLHTPPGGYDDGLRVEACSVNDFATSVISRTRFLVKLIPAVFSVMAELEAGHFQNILNCWRDHDYTRGRRLTWLTAAGKQIEGVASGINDDGLLFIIDERGQTHEVLSGDIQLALTTD